MANDELLRIDLELAFCNGINVREVTIADIQKAFESRQLTAEDLTDCYIQRINGLNPVLNAVIEVNPDALQIAKELDEERLKSGSRGPLHGIPILLKDNIATNDKMETCSGSLALVGLKPTEDSDVVAKLRKAGAIILGKANLSEFSNFRGRGIPDGWSGRGKHTHNAYVLSENPLGSSSGSAVSVATNLAVASLGSETDGSLIAPASCAAVVGFKPTWGSVSSVGVIPLSPSQDCVGPLTRTVADCALLYSAIAKKPLQTKCFDISHPDLSDCMKMEFKVGFLRKPSWEVDPKQLKRMELALQAFKYAGVKLAGPLDEVEDGAFDAVSMEIESETLKMEFKTAINEYLSNKNLKRDSEYCNEIQCLADVIKFNRDNPTAENYDQIVLEESEATEGTSDPTYLEKFAKNRKAARKAIDDILEKYELDAIVSPSDGTGKHYCAVAGYPVISVPVGFAASGNPFGLSFFGTADSDEKLLLLAYRFEQAFKGRHTSLFKK